MIFERLRESRHSHTAMLFTLRSSSGYQWLAAQYFSGSRRSLWVIAVGRTRSGEIVVDLRTTSMTPRQTGRKSDAGAGDCSAGCMRMIEGRGEGKCRAAKPSDRRDYGSLRVRAIINSDRLAVAKANYVGNRD